MTLNKKIYKSDSDVFLLGICAGIAEYFEIDPTLVRIIFILLTFFGGTGVLIYIIMAFIIPSKGGTQNDVEEKIQEVALNIKKEVNRYKKSERKVSLIGLFLILFGGMLLWNQIVPYKIREEIFWPTILIMSGLFLVLRK